MPELSRWFIRTAFVFMLVGFTLGDLILTEKGLGIIPGMWAWLPIHVYCVLFGWIIQLTMGMAYWILPRWGVTEGRNRGNTQLPIISYISLNTGLLCLLPTPWLRNVWGAELAAALGAVGGTLLLLAFVAFSAHAWPRVKPFLV